MNTKKYRMDVAVQSSKIIGYDTYGDYKIPTYKDLGGSQKYEKGIPEEIDYREKYAQLNDTVGAITFIRICDYKRVYNIPDN
jgi:hypothetical protein